MRIVERKLIGKKKSTELCEDGLFISNDFVTVVDGVTSKGKQQWKGISSGNYAKNIIVEKMAVIEKSASAEECLSQLNGHLKQAYLKHVQDDNISEWIRASVIIYSRERNEIWSYGDCNCMLNKKFFGHTKLIDSVLATLRSIIINNEIMHGKSINELIATDVGREKIMPFLKLQLDFENRNCQFGYPILNGHSFNQDLIVKYAVKTDDEIILASDGYPKIFSTLEESEQYLGEIVTNDPLCYEKYLSTKGLQKGSISFDDRCYCRFIVD